MEFMILYDLQLNFVFNLCKNNFTLINNKNHFFCLSIIEINGAKKLLENLQLFALLSDEGIKLTSHQNYRYTTNLK